MQISLGAQRLGGGILIVVLFLFGLPRQAAAQATGSWSTFKKEELETIELAPGTHLVTIRSLKTSGPLMKLRCLRLVPR